MKGRLQKILAHRGVASRRASELLIMRGSVKINGVTARVGDVCDTETDEIIVNGVPLPPVPEPVYIMLYKPRGVVSTLKDENGRKTVRDCLPPELGYLVPVGRLDISSEGLLLMTNDGVAVNHLTHPSFEIEKSYMAWVQGDMESSLPKLRSSINIDGRSTMPAKVKYIAGGIVLISIREGRNRQVRRLCEMCGLVVTRLKRISEGTLNIGKMTSGQWRKLTQEEIAYIKNLSSGNI